MMSFDERFGLPLSLTEALRADPSPDAAVLASLLEEGGSSPPRVGSPRTGGWRHRWRSALAGVSLAAGLATQGHAGTTSLEGRWTMAAAQSSFEEQVTGPAPDQATVVFTRDAPDRLTYELSESRRGVPVAYGTYDVSFSGAGSTSSVDGTRLQVTAERDAGGEVVIRAPAVDGLQALIRVRRTGPATAPLDPEGQGAAGPRRVARLSLMRSPTASN